MKQHHIRIRSFGLSVVCIITLLCTGCWDYQEYEEMALVFAVGFDYLPDSREIEVSIFKTNSIPSPEQTGSSLDQRVDIVRAHTLVEAFSKFQNINERELFWGFTRLLILGKAMAADRFKELIDFYSTSPILKTSSLILLSPGSASTVLSASDPDQRLQISNRFEYLLKNMQQQGIVYPVKFINVLEQLAEDGIEVAMPRIRAHFYGASPSKSGNSIMQSPGYFQIEGMSVFRSYRLAGNLDDHESLFLAWMLNKPNRTRIHIMEKEAKQRAGIPSDMSFRLSEISSKIDVELTSGRPEAIVTLKAQATLIDYSLPSDMQKQEFVNQLNRILSGHVLQQSKLTIKKIQERYRTDVIGIGQTLYRQHPQAWKKNYKQRWDTTFPRIPFQVKTDLKVIITGTKRSGFREQ